MTMLNSLSAAKSPVAAGLFGDCSVLPDRPVARPSAVIVPLFRPIGRTVRALAA